MEKLFKDVLGVFLSIKTTIFLLVVIASVSITGTLIPQQKEVDEYVFHYGETLYQLFDLFGLSNVFGSWWFRLLLVLLMVNLVACSTSRVPRFLAQKGLTKREWVGRLGPHLTHFSLIVILAGSLIGNIWGFKGYVNIPQGEAASAVAVRGSHQPLDLNFAIRCDRFEVSYYPGSQTPKEYLSDLVVTENGREVLKKTIQVNDPLKFKGISFYQSSYGFIPPKPGESKAELEIIPKGNGSEGFRLKIAEGETREIPGTNHRVQFVSFVPDFALDKENRIISKSEQPNNPAVQVNIFQNGKLSFKGWSFLKFPDFHGSKDDTYRVKLLDYSGGRPYTGLQVVKDPGVWVVWTGFGLLIIGLCFAFGFRRKSSPKGGNND
jgi:cytochrome c biogenesis protein